MATRFNPYRTFAHDGKALRQITELPTTVSQQCKECGSSFEVQEIRLDCLCDECQAKKEGK